MYDAYHCHWENAEILAIYSFRELVLNTTLHKLTTCICEELHRMLSHTSAFSQKRYYMNKLQTCHMLHRWAGLYTYTYPAHSSCIIPYGRKFWRRIYFGGLAVLRAIRQYFIRQNFTVCCHQYS